MTATVTILTRAEQGDVWLMLLGGRDRAVGIVGDRYHAIARIVLDQIFESRRELRIVLHDHDLQHERALPNPRNLRGFDAHPKRGR